jgi:hypothetical protein
MLSNTGHLFLFCEEDSHFGVSYLCPFTDLKEAIYVEDIKWKIYL